MAKQRPREVVLVHGLGLDQPGWGEVMWGSPYPGQHGRLLRAAVYAYTNDVDRIVLGSGATRRAGRTDAEYALDLYRTGSAHVANLLAMDVADAYDWIERTVVLDTESANAEAELVSLFEHCINTEHTATVLTSPTELEESVRLAMTITADERYAPVRSGLRFIAADTDRPVTLFESPPVRDKKRSPLRRRG